MGCDSDQNGEDISEQWASNYSGSNAYLEGSLRRDGEHYHVDATETSSVALCSLFDSVITIMTFFQVVGILFSKPVPQAEATSKRLSLV